MQHFWRPKITEERFIELLLDAVVSEYDNGRGSCSVIDGLKKEFRDLPECPKQENKN